MNHNHHCNLKGKQSIESLLNDDNIAHIANNEQQFRMNHQDISDSRAIPTEKEMQYIRRIYSLMSLVSKQTKEIQSLRSIIEAYSQQDTEHCIHCNHTDNNRKKSKQS